MPDIENAVSASTNNAQLATNQQQFPVFNHNTKKATNQSQDCFINIQQSAASKELTPSTINGKNSNSNCSFIRIYIGNSTTVVIWMLEKQSRY